MRFTSLRQLQADLVAKYSPDIYVIIMAKVAKATAENNGALFEQACADLDNHSCLGHWHWKDCNAVTAARRAQTMVRNGTKPGRKKRQTDDTSRITLLTEPGTGYRTWGQKRADALKAGSGK